MYRGTVAIGDMEKREKIRLGATLVGGMILGTTIGVTLTSSSLIGMGF